MKSILISIQPQWVERILNGGKCVEIRKTIPKCELPCKVYIYCSIGKYKLRRIPCHYVVNKYPFETIDLDDNKYDVMNGKVVAEFTLKKIDEIEICYPSVFINNEEEEGYWFQSNACIYFEEIMYYITQKYDYNVWESKNYKIYGWHIDNLKIYDKSKELSEFTHNVADYSNGVVMYSLKKEPLKIPPQSWCYVEECRNEV